MKHLEGDGTGEAPQRCKSPGTSTHLKGADTTCHLAPNNLGTRTDRGDPGSGAAQTP